MDQERKKVDEVPLEIHSKVQKKLNQTVHILGCGWLGFALAQRLIEEGYSVGGSTTRSDKLALLQEQNIVPFLIDLDVDADLPESFLEADILIVCFPPGKNRNKQRNYLEQCGLIAKQVGQSKIKHVLFTSSTSVYPDYALAFDESTNLEPESEQGAWILAAEDLFVQLKNQTTTILRFSGLVDQDRNPLKFMALGKSKSNGNASVNWVHRADCIAIMLKILEKQNWGQLYNVSSDEQPLRKEVYAHLMPKFGYEIPEFEDGPFHIRIIKNDWLKEDLDYQFLYPDPMFML